MSAKVIDTTPADEFHQVATVQGGNGAYMRHPCAECPWRVDRAGSFPAEAFRISANTAYDMATRTFGCHMAGREHPATCAGFLLRGADHNLTVRLRWADGTIQPDEISTDAELHDSYRAMAEANGVAPDDPALRRCRP